MTPFVVLYWRQYVVMMFTLSSLFICMVMCREPNQKGGNIFNLCHNMHKLLLLANGANRRTNIMFKPAWTRIAYSSHNANYCLDEQPLACGELVPTGIHLHSAHGEVLENWNTFFIPTVFLYLQTAAIMWLQSRLIIHQPSTPRVPACSSHW